MKISVVALAALWLPYVTLNLGAGSALARGYMKIGETAHYELLTMEIYTRALRCICPAGPHRLQGDAEAGRRRRRDRVGAQAAPGARSAPSLLGAGTVLRLLDLAGVGPLPDLPGIAAVIVPLLGLIELRRILRTLFAVGRRQQRRLVYRFEGDAPAECYSEDGHVSGRLIDASAAGVGLVLDAPLDGRRQAGGPARARRRGGRAHEVAAQVEVRSCREVEGRYLVGATITEIDPASRMRLMEWCYVVCSHERLRGHRPARSALPPKRRGDRRCRCTPSAAAGGAVAKPLKRSRVA